jgi:Leucine-rich repeat (LRR) protein
MFFQSYGLIVSLAVNGIAQNKFSYVPDDFLVGNQIPSVSFKCNHGFNVNQGILIFSVYAFTDSFGECGLTGDLTFSNCNLRQFDSAVLKNCRQLNKLAFMDSHVESLVDIPTLGSLKNFTVYSPKQWTGANQRGLSRMTLAPGASLPQLTYLDLTGNSLEDDSIEFVSDEKTIEVMHLEGNNFAAVPNLTGSSNLHTFSISLNSSSLVSILLPNPRDQSRSLNASFYSGSKAINEVALLEGK